MPIPAALPTTGTAAPGSESLSATLTTRPVVSHSRPASSHGLTDPRLSPSSVPSPTARSRAPSARASTRAAVVLPPRPSHCAVAILGSTIRLTPIAARVIDISRAAACGLTCWTVLRACGRHEVPLVLGEQLRVLVQEVGRDLAPAQACVLHAVVVEHRAVRAGDVRGEAGAHARVPRSSVDGDVVDLEVDLQRAGEGPLEPVLDLAAVAVLAGPAVLAGEAEVSVVGEAAGHVTPVAAAERRERPADEALYDPRVHRPRVWYAATRPRRPGPPARPSRTRGRRRGRRRSPCRRPRTGPRGSPAPAGPRAASGSRA